MKAIELEGLTKLYKKKPAINQVDLTVEKGEIYGFIGPNGSGKSTTIKSMLNFIYPDHGTATILGLDSVKNAKEIRKRTGYVSSDVRFYPAMTTLDILKYVAEFHQLKNSKEQIDYFMERFDIDGKKKCLNCRWEIKRKLRSSLEFCQIQNC